MSAGLCLEALGDFSSWNLVQSPVCCYIVASYVSAAAAAAAATAAAREVHAESTSDI